MATMQRTSERAQPQTTDLPHLPIVGSQCEMAYGDVLLYTGILQRGRAVVLPPYLEAVVEPRGARVIPDMTIRPEVSAHQVAFGLLIGRHDHISQTVALKPFSSAADALHEVNGYLVLEKLGVETFKPYGAFPSVDGRHYVVVTEFRDDLLSLDRDEWVTRNRLSTEQQIEQAARNTRTVTQVVGALAHIHSFGVYHPDGQIKNFAKGPDGRIGIIDTEGLREVALNSSDTAGLAWDDIQKLARSLIAPAGEGGDTNIYGVGMLSGMSLENTRDALLELIVEPYVEALAKAREGADEDRIQQIDRLIDGVISFYSVPSWPSHFRGVNQ